MADTDKFKDSPGESLPLLGETVIPLSEVDPQTGEMTPVSCFAHAALVVDITVDDETGEVEVLKMNSAYEVGRALNARLVEQQLRGGAWMGMSHAAWETTEPYYPDRSHGPVDFNHYLMPGPGDISPHHISVLERPAPDGPFGGKGPGEMCANPVLPAVEVQGDVGQPDDVAQLARFLIGPESRWISGQCIDVDGGHGLRRGPDFSTFVG